MDPLTSNYASQERTRVVAVAQSLFLERGVQAVGLADVALALRLPTATVERYFPAGKTALVEASLTAYVEEFHQRLLTQFRACSSAVEELLLLRQVLREMPGDGRSLVEQDIAAHCPVQWQQMYEIRAATTRNDLRHNLRRGLAEGLYRTGLNPDEQAEQWLNQCTQLLQTARTPQALAEGFGTQLTEFMNSLLTPAGAYVARRLQEGPPYY